MVDPILQHDTHSHFDRPKINKKREKIRRELKRRRGGEGEGRVLDNAFFEAGRGRNVVSLHEFAEELRGSSYRLIGCDKR